MKQEKCPYCGHVMTPRAESLSKGLIQALIKFVSVVKQKGFNEIHLQSEVALTKNEYNNFQKLRYHGLVHHAKDSNGEIKSGSWIITRLGGQFLRSEREVPKIVFVMNNQIVGKGEEMTKITDFFNETLMNNEEYWQKEFGFDIEQGRLL